MTKNISTPMKPPLKGWYPKIVIWAWYRITAPTAIALRPSISGLLVTTEAMIADKPEEKDAASGMPGGMPGGMGGMGGMGM